MVDHQYQLTESLYNQLNYIYPFENVQKLKERFDSVKQNSDEKSIETRFKNVKEYESLNFPDFNLYNSSYQKIIRNNSPFSSDTSALDFFKILSKQINDRNLNKLISIEIITYLFENANINIQMLDPRGLLVIKKLAQKFAGFSPNQVIQFYLLMPPDNQNDQIYPNISYKSNIEYLLSFDLSSLTFPQNFFNSSLIDDLIINDSSHVKKLSAKCFRYLNEIYQILGEVYRYEVNSKQFQTKILVSQVEDKSIHEKNIEEFKVFLSDLISELRRLDLISESQSLYVNKQVLEYLIVDFKFDYFQNLNTLYLMKKSLNGIKYNTKLVWSILKPEIFSSSPEETKRIVHNVQQFSNFIDSVKIIDTLKLINTDLVRGLIEAERLVSVEQLNAVIRLNRILISQDSQLADLKTIKNFFKINITEASLNVEELLEQTYSRNVDLSATQTLDTEQISLDVEIRDSEFEKSLSTKALFDNDDVTILIGSNEHKEYNIRKPRKKYTKDKEYIIKVFELIIITLSVLYLLYYVINYI
ncbi:hypothetical protein BpHYR1_049051 [Brachionus plicatilis]|uniref:Uncharacterized protein n=1 Tax=Brachionus plicatilis TaxID=10195 RepID=A0A3M7PQV6_BRAPC|nr:hypothetical protein BpHYR1_049051 [Brachionus plicatilis]